MTLQELFNNADAYSIPLLVLFIALPITSAGLPVCHAERAYKEAPWKYIYSALIFLSCIPGIGALVVTLYSVAFFNADLRNMNIVSYFVPILSMVATLMLLSKKIQFEDIPGFERLYGLLIALACTFVLLLILERLHIYVLFWGSSFGLIILFAFLYFGLRWGMKKAMK